MKPYKEYTQRNLFKEPGMCYAYCLLVVPAIQLGASLLLYPYFILSA